MLTGVIPADGYIAVNVSGRDITDAAVGPMVQAAVDDTGAGFAFERLVVEVTETAVIVDLDHDLQVLEVLRELGVSIAIDDFGTGYSSLTYLRRFPAAIVKIDRSFIPPHHPEPPEDRAIVASVVSLAHAIGMRTVAEGVETWEQLTVLKGMGCDFGQGFLWSPAVPFDELAAWMRRRGRFALADPARV